MPQLKIGIQLASLRLPARKALAVAARLGAQAIEIDARGEIRPETMTQTAVRELRRLVEEHGLAIAAVGFHTRRGYDVADELERRIAATKRAMKLAADLRCALVINQVGRVPGEPGGANWQHLREALGELGQYGQHVGTLFAAQTGSESGADLARLISALGTQSIGVDFDPGNLIVNGFSPLEAVESLSDNILHVHAHDGVRDLARGRGLEVELGRGSADFPALLGALEDRQYRGYFTVSRDEGFHSESEVSDAISYLKSL